MNFAQVCLKFKLTLKKHICEQAFKKIFLKRLLHGMTKTQNETFVGVHIVNLLTARQAVTVFATRQFSGQFFSDENCCKRGRKCFWRGVGECLHV